jgi:hypothetical protein
MNACSAVFGFAVFFFLLFESEAEQSHQTNHTVFFRHAHHEIAPKVCAASLSYKRPHYLVQTVRSFLFYMTVIEPDVPWTLQILDNGSSEEELKTTATELAPLRALNTARSTKVRLVHLKKTVGLSKGFELLFFTLCAQTKAPYILSLEDDWRARAFEWTASFPILSAGMQTLEQNKQMLEVWMRDVHLGMFKHGNWTKSHALTADMQPLRLDVQRLSCMPGSAWGGYTNGGSLKHVARLQALGTTTLIDGEYELSSKSCENGYHVAIVCPDTRCVADESYRGLFEHIGLERVNQTNDARFNEAVVRGGEEADLLDLTNDANNLLRA